MSDDRSGKCVRAFLNICGVAAILGVAYIVFVSILFTANYAMCNMEKIACVSFLEEK